MDPDVDKDSCQIVTESNVSVKRRELANISKYFIIGLATLHLLKEVFQLTQVGSSLMKKLLLLLFNKETEEICVKFVLCLYEL